MTCLLDPLGRIEEIRLNTATLASFVHHGLGPPVTRTFGNGVVVSETSAQQRGRWQHHRVLR